MSSDKKRYNTSTRQLDHLVDNIRMMVNSDVNINPRVAKTAIATESFTDSDLMELNSSVNNIRGTIEGICESLNLSKLYSKSSTDRCWYSCSYHLW